MSEPEWKSCYPIRRTEEHASSRRSFVRALGCAGVLTAALAAGRRMASSGAERFHPPLRVCRDEDLPPGGSRLFRYPDKHSPAILVRRENGELAAYSQSCTHLMCPVHFRAASDELVCPCHEGFFSAVDGKVLAGPPTRPLPRFVAEVRDGWIHVGPACRSSSTT